MWSKRPRRSLQSSITWPDAVLRDDDRRPDIRLLDSLALRRHVGRVVHLDDLAGRRLDPVCDVRRCDEQVEVELALEALADDLHVQQTQEAAAEPEPERLRGLRLVEEGRVIQLQPLECVAQLRVVVRVGRVERREDHRLHVLVARQRLVGGPRLGGERVADPQLGHVLQSRDDVADLAGASESAGSHRRREEADLLGLEARSLRHRVARSRAREARRRRRARTPRRRGTGRTRSRRRELAGAPAGRRWAGGSARRSRRVALRRPRRSSPRRAARGRLRRRRALPTLGRHRPGWPAADRSC